MSTALDYTGRQVDLLAFQGQDPDRESLLTQALVREGGHGELCAGTQKLAQRWLLEFLTPVGSMTFLPDRGCAFMLYWARGLLRTTADARQAFFLAAKQVESKLWVEESDEMPLDERLDYVELLALTVQKDGLILRLQIWSKAGKSRKALLPLTTKLNGL